MRNMSFALTTSQIMNGSKTVTRSVVAVLAMWAWAWIIFGDRV